jgi:hypothetical protein
LWALPPERLANLASGELTATQSVRDAAQMALGVKREFLSPEDFGSEGAALDRLAASLAMLPDFSLQEIAIASGRGPIHRPQQPAEVAARPTRSRNRVLRVVVVAMILLLALEALAQAGVGVVSPIGAVVDQFDGEPNESEPDDLRSHVDPEATPSEEYEARVLAPPARGTSRVDSGARSKTKTKTELKSKNENHARGRLAHYAQGREQQRSQRRDGHGARTRKQRRLAERVERVVRETARSARGAVKSRPWRDGDRGRGGRSK